MFSKFAQFIAHQCGRATAFGLACFSIVVWAATGPVFRYSDTWQLVINTGTTIVTFLMVFLIQNTQNRDTAAIKLQLSELIRVNNALPNTLVSPDRLPEEKLSELEEQSTKRAYPERTINHDDPTG